MVVIPSRLARELGVRPERVTRLVKWYARSKGKEPGDFKRPWPRPTSRPIYVMPDDFKDFVLKHLERRREEVMTCDTKNSDRV